ncbi:hypothetical protein CA13_16640 [Planctomycetes bacterium CA13]|uniref:GH16 domain-containing protein n=2 Tax=Novipirellula herctigrandis TaxID=2527986 RepID=A0A5C5Z078_9BACT|nr:hypothetical protein CA13_16640 [Planctomycetes bacterium CA13]
MRITLIALLLLCCSVCGLAQEVTDLPAESSRHYADAIDPSISDEFNSSRLDTQKWGRRNTGGASVADHSGDDSLIVMESEESDDHSSTQYVSVKATAKNGPVRTGGIVSRASGYYGFYVVRFRYRGLNSPEVIEKKTIWHPAVWSGKSDNIDDANRTTASDGYWLEIDFVEWETQTGGWSCDAPARLVDSKGVKRKVVTKGHGMEKAIMKDEVAIHDARWQTVGLEYSPDFLKLWQWKNGRWEYYNDRHVAFVEDDLRRPESKYTITTIGKKAAQPCFWLLGNVVSRYLVPAIESKTIKHTMEDMSFDIDYFRYYRHKSIQDADWKWEKQLPNGG